MSLLDRLLDVGAEALKKGADALAPAEGEVVSPLEAMARAGGQALARGVAHDLRTPHCEARTRLSMGHMLKCGRDATMRKDGIKFCGDCAPTGAVPMTVQTKEEASHGDGE